VTSRAEKWVATATVILLALLWLFGCAAPCLSTVTTYAEGGKSYGSYDRYGSYDDVRGGVSLEWDATRKACAPEAE